MRSERSGIGPGPAWALAAVLALCAVALAAPLGRPGHTVIVADGLRFAFPLEHRLIVTGSDTVLVDGEILPASEYDLSPGSGFVVFHKRPQAWAVILVSYRYVPFLSPHQEFRLHQPVPAAEGPAFQTLPVESESTGQTVSGDVLVSGEKSIGVSVGGVDGSGISQSTRLSVSGTIEGIGIAAELSDQSSGIPAEGTTREVEQLDRIAIKVKGQNWQGGFGDVDLGLGALGFGRLERKAVGGLVDLQAMRGTSSLAYARPRGQFGHVVLSGRAGVQGPYLLALDQRQAQVVPASERVYLNGQRMTRGWDADYTIDYSTGELFFTCRRVIESDSRIEAFFDYVNEAYERDAVLAASSARAGPVEFLAGVFREGDNPNRPYDEDLTEEERKYLAGIAADTSRAWLDGSRFVGPGNGSYVKEPAGFFRYVGRSQGDYEVTFTLVGDSLGSYTYDDSLLAYRYVGEGQGNYVAQRKVTLPSRDELATFGVSAQSSGVSASVSGAVCRKMLNLFAQTGAPRLDGAVAPSAAWQAERFSVSYDGRFRSQGFRLPGQDTVIDFAYRWGQERQREVASTNELRLEVRPASNLVFAAEAGVLDQIRSGLVTRWLSSARLWSLSLTAARAGAEQRYELGANPLVWRLQPRFGLGLFSRPEQQRRQAGIGLSVSPVENLSLGADYRYDDVSRPDSAAWLSPRFASRIWETGGLAQVEARWNRRDALTVDARVVRQSRRYPPASGEDWTRWLADLSLTASPFAGVRAWASLAQSYRLVQMRDEVFRYVGAGNGHYSRDTVSGRYFPDPHGDYERVLVALGRFTACRERNFSVSSQLSTWQPVEFSGSAGIVSVTDTIPVQVVENHSVRMTLRLWEPVFGAALGTSGSRSWDRTLTATGTDNQRDERYLELHSTYIRPIDVRTRAENYEELRRFASGLVDLAEQGWRLRAEPVVARLGLELTVAVGWAWIGTSGAFPEADRLRLIEREAGLARSFNISERGRIRASANIVQRSATVVELPYEVGLSRPLGLTPGAGLEFSQMISDLLLATARYEFTDRPDRSAEHRASAELRAYF
ncbi:MAG: hypothetical protein ABIL25_09795 [candidate division WOR-3 bacterium]